MANNVYLRRNNTLKLLISNESVLACFLDPCPPSDGVG